MMVRKVTDGVTKHDALKIETDCTHNILVGRKFGIDHIGVIDYVAAEQEASPDSEDEVHCLAKWDEDADKPSHH